LVDLLVFTHILTKCMVQEAKSPVKNLVHIYIYIYIYIYDVKSLALLGAPYIYGISRLRVKLEWKIDMSKEIWKAASSIKVPKHVRVWLAIPFGHGFQWVKLVHVWSVLVWCNISEPGSQVGLESQTRTCMGTLRLLSVASVQNKNTQTLLLDACKLELLAWLTVAFDASSYCKVCFPSALAFFFFSRLRFCQQTSDTIVMLMFPTRLFIGPHPTHYILNTSMHVINSILSCWRKVSFLLPLIISLGKVIKRKNEHSISTGHCRRGVQHSQ
jgi:hypothetical protein